MAEPTKERVAWAEPDAEIEREFIESWDLLKRYYCYYERPEVHAWIEAMRAKGFDKTLRAGTSVNLFILSRSRNNGLGMHQARVTFSLKQDGLYATARDAAGEKTLKFDVVELHPRMESMLCELESMPIDVESPELRPRRDIRNTAG